MLQMPQKIDAIAKMCQPEKDDSQNKDVHGKFVRILHAEVSGNGQE